MFRTIIVALAAIIGVLIASAITGMPATAEETADTRDLEVIRVIAPRIVRERVGFDEVLSAEKQAVVSFADIDITRTDGFFELEERIIDAATRLCDELAELLPRGHPRRSLCIRRAVDDAVDEAREAARLLAGR